MSLFTEEEAKLKLCPLVKHCINETGVIHDKDVPLYGHGNCQASNCMAWRFVELTHHRETELWSRSKNKQVNSAWGDDSWWKPIGEDADKEPPPAKGYCGAFANTKLFNP